MSGARGIVLQQCDKARGSNACIPHDACTAREELVNHFPTVTPRFNRSIRALAKLAVCVIFFVIEYDRWESGRRQSNALDS